MAIVNKFIISPNYLTDNKFYKVIFLTDVRFWHDNIVELQDWCRQNNSLQKGMTVLIPDDLTLSLFILRWT